MTYCVGIWTGHGLDLIKIDTRWEQALRQAVGRLPQIRFRAARRPPRALAACPGGDHRVVEPGAREPVGAALQPQAKPPSS